MELDPNYFQGYNSVYVLCDKSALHSLDNEIKIIGVFVDYNSALSAMRSNSKCYIVGPVPFHDSRRFKLFERKPFNPFMDPYDDRPGSMDIE